MNRGSSGIFTLSYVDPQNSSGGGGGGVTSVSGVTGAVILAAGSGIALSTIGQTITISATGSTVTLTNTQIAYGSPTNTVTSNSSFTYDPTGLIFSVGFGGSTFLQINETTERYYFGDFGNATGSGIYLYIQEGPEIAGIYGKYNAALNSPLALATFSSGSFACGDINNSKNGTTIIVNDNSQSWTLGNVSAGGLVLAGSNLTSIVTVSSNTSTTLRIDALNINVSIGDISGGGAVFTANNPVGSHNLSSRYSSSRDDTGTVTPVNFLYSSTSGNLLSSPLSHLPGGTVTNVGTGAGLTGGPITTSGAISADANLLSGTIGMKAEGNGAVLSTGLLDAFVVSSYAGAISGWIITASQSGSITFDVWKLNGAIPTITNTITASLQPTLTSGQFVSSTTLTGWTTAVSVGDVFAFNINSVSGIMSATIQLPVVKT